MATCTYTDRTMDHDFSNAANWSEGRLPADGDDVVLDLDKLERPYNGLFDGRLNVIVVREPPFVLPEDFRIMTIACHRKSSSDVLVKFRFIRPEDLMRMG